MKRLEVELDFHHSPGEVTVRFYRNEDHRRTLLRHQEFFNLAKKFSQAPDPDWDELDQRFLRGLLPELDKPYLLQLNHQLLKVSPAKLDLWLQKWATVPERFLERDSQKPYTRHQPKAQLRLLLQCQGDKTQMRAVLEGLNERSSPWHMVRRSIDFRRREVLIKDLVHALDLPLPAELLDQIFGDGGPAVPTAALAQHLPVVLRGRLDLLGGPSVTQVEVKGKTKLALSCEGADLHVVVSVNTTPLASLDLPLAYNLKRQGRRFVVEALSAPTLAPVRELLKALPLEPTPEQYFKLTGTPEHVAALYEVCHALPPGVEFSYDEALAGVFGDHRGVAIDIDAEGGEGWVQMDLKCHWPG